LLPPALCFLLFVPQQPLLQGGILNTGDLTIAALRRGTSGYELLKVWTRDAAIRPPCLPSPLAVPVGIMHFVATTRPAERPGRAVPAEQGRERA